MLRWTNRTDHNFTDIALSSQAVGHSAVVVERLSMQVESSLRLNSVTTPELGLNYRLFVEARQAGTHAEFFGGFGEGKH